MNRLPCSVQTIRSPHCSQIFKIFSVAPVCISIVIRLSLSPSLFAPRRPCVRALHSLRVTLSLDDTGRLERVIEAGPDQSYYEWWVRLFLPTLLMSSFQRHVFLHHLAFRLSVRGSSALIGVKIEISVEIACLDRTCNLKGYMPKSHGCGWRGCQMPDSIQPKGDGRGWVSVQRSRTMRPAMGVAKQWAGDLSDVFVVFPCKGASMAQMGSEHGAP